MNKARINVQKEWKTEELDKGMRFSYPIPQGAKGFYPYGFVQKNHSAANLVGWHGIFVTLREKPSGAQKRDPNPNREKLQITVSFADREPLKVQVPFLLQNGCAKVEVPFSIFPLELARGNRWEFVTALELSWGDSALEIAECTIRRRPGIYLHMPVRGKSGDPGESLVYEGSVHNCSSEMLAVTAAQSFEGWESLIAEICLGKEDSEIILSPGESAPIRVSVTVHDYMVPGGHENTKIRVRGQGSGSACQDWVEIKTLCRLPHPYLYHNALEWKKRMTYIRQYEPYAEAFRGYVQTADAWTVTDPMEDRDFCYETKEESNIMSAAYVYALTGEEKYAQKLADFFRRFTHPQKGYPARKRGCSQSYVQEGHFFKHLAIAFDIIYDSGALNKEERAAVEQSFRLYMDMLDTHILDGRISNWILSELQGALFCALTLQDMDRALRFAFGNGGIFQQFRCGIFNDGWWHECSVGYNTWVSSIMLHTAHALLPFGYNLVHTQFQIPFNKEVSSTYAGETTKVDFGMYNQKWGGNHKPSVCIKDMFDAPLPFLDYRGVLFGIADSDEKKLSGVHFGSTYDLAYHYYQDAAYLPVIAMNGADAIFGEPEIQAVTDPRPVAAESPQTEPEKSARHNACADNIGLALLRSQKPGRPQKDQIQAVLRYGSHGNAHGHFDITDLLSVMRYGRSFFNPENCWWGYAHFMYKFYVQCSLTKNMVVVDEKMQNPADSRRILWHTGETLQAAGIEVRTTWSYPPYGGMVYTQDGQSATKEELRKRCQMNGCFLPILEGEDSPGYGELTGFTEPILQRRVMALTDDYIVLFDYVEGQTEHTYDSLMQIKGFLGIEGEQVKKAEHTEQMNPNPASDAQFITDCQWYEVKGGSVARFRTLFTQEHAGERLICDRSSHNEPGILNMDVYTPWPKETRQMVGRVAVYEGWAAEGNGYTIPLSYRAQVDGVTAASGAFDGWILGRGEISLDVKQAARVSLILRQGAMHNEIGEPVRTPQGVFWGEICLELADGTVINLGQCLRGELAAGLEKSQSGEAVSGLQTAVAQDTRAVPGESIVIEPERCPEPGLDRQHSVENREPGTGWAQRIQIENLDTSCGIGRDYRGGRVTIVGTEYPYSFGASPIDHDRESRIDLDLVGLDAVRLQACVGVDAFPGDEWQKRKTYAVRSRGKAGRFVTVIEPYESESLIAQVEAQGPDSVEVTLKDGRVQTVSLTGMQGGEPQVRLESR